MYPEVEILGKLIPTYWLCTLAGITISGICALFRHNRFQELQEVDITNSAALIFIGVLIGSRLLYLLTISPIIIRNYHTLMTNSKLAYDTLANGMVFYGGLFGAILTLYLYTGKYGLDRKLFFDFYTPLFPLFHSFGRIGCFLNGCCHGKVSEKHGIAYHNSISAQNNVPYFPIQLVNSVLNILLFTALIVYERRHHKQGQTIYVYLALYATGRFLVEFFRGDNIRGFLFGISTSQIISLLVLAFLILISIRKAKNTKNVA